MSINDQIRSIHERYGHYVMVMASALSAQWAHAFVQNMNQACEAAQQDMFDRLEQEIDRVRAERPELRGFAVFQEAARRLDEARARGQEEKEGAD